MLAGQTEPLTGQGQDNSVFTLVPGAVVLTHCSALLGFLVMKCWHLYLPRELRAILLLVKYSPTPTPTPRL